MGIQLLYQNAFHETVASLASSKTGLAHLVTGLDDSSRAVMIAQAFQADPSQYVIVEPRDRQLQELFDDLLVLLPDVPILFFPAEESMAVEYSISSLDNRLQRIEAMNHLLAGQPCIVLTSVAGLRMRLTPVATWQASLKTIEVGDQVELVQLEDLFSFYGYQRQAMLQSPGEFSIRGGIVDFYPLNHEFPIRLDFFDDEIDSIRTFDPETQLSLENIEKVMITPAKDILFPLGAQQQLIPELRSHLNKELKKIKDTEVRDNLALHQEEVLLRLEQGEPLKYAQAYLSFWDDQSTCLLDYIQGQGRLIVMELGRIQQVEFQMIEENYYWLEQAILKGEIIPGVEMKLNAYENIRYSSLPTLYFSVMQRGLTHLKFESIHAFQYRSMNKYYDQMPLIKADIDQWLSQGFVIQVALNQSRDLTKIIERLEEYEIEPCVIQDKQGPAIGAVNLMVNPISSGFELPLAKWVVLTEQELFDRVKHRKRMQQSLSNAERIKSYDELSQGDYVVHDSHGIGKYTGIETMEINGVHQDLIAIEYQDQARILIPVENIQQLQKYVASESKTPRLNRLGGTEWIKTKQKVQSKIEDIADELISIHAERESQKGYSFGPDHPEQLEFEQAFPYPETEDQLRSIKEIKADMEKDRPMDRLLVGDVGYGKTEVAFRAIFKAVMEGKQVAFLVPTTILAQQHYNSMIERFNTWPFEIGLLSRFVTPSEQKETLAKLKTGAMSIVVGTHRLLSQDIHFNDLGLLIVDEEQRFGVKHKERLKQLKASIDVLTLTATPIPRTLHMSMIGVRDLSIIETPPHNRFPVQTYVMERNEGVIKMAVEREMARGGQVFYLYNRVATIDRRAQELSDLIPEARIAVAHGQMPENQLEQVLLDFISGEFDILVTTTIIETGVDIANANTLFVEDADRMGLSTLYQLRGRVGRTHRLAYAYLMYQPFKQLSEISEKRLNAIREFTELGAGFKLAMRDLSIRGAGNLLGKQQSGFIDAVGYELYTQMLKAAVLKKKGQSQQTSAVQSIDFEWKISLDAYLPSTYIGDERQKIGIYKSLNQIDSESAYQELQDELIDRFGEFPDQVSDLLDITLIKHYSTVAGITIISRKRRDILILFNEAASEILKGPNVFRIMKDIHHKIQVQYRNQKIELAMNVYNQANDQWLAALIQLTRQASEIIQEEMEHKHEIR